MARRPAVVEVENARFYCLWLAFGILLVHIIGIAQFTKGFLLTRPCLDTINTEIPSGRTPTFEKAVVLVVDALRYDFIVEQPESDLPYHNNFPLHEINDDVRHTFTVQFMADPPTTTLQRLKGLTTGSLPAFIDAGSNFAGSDIEEDNWVHQASLNGSVSFVGDDTWNSLFANELQQCFPYPSLNVRDLHTVDNGVKQILPQLIANQTNKVVVGHMLGVDHVGHRYGPNHPAMAEKLRETFEFVKQIVDQIDDETVLLLFGDHGMDQTGNHGGDSFDELNAGLWAYSKAPKFHAEGDYQVNQIDLVPTISGWLGLPIPFNSLGFPIQKGFREAKDYKNIVEDSNIQLKTYADRVGMPLNSTIVDAKEFQKQALLKFKVAWAEFDPQTIFNGCTLILASILQFALIYKTSSQSTLRKCAIHMLAGGVLGLVVTFFWKFSSERVLSWRWFADKSLYVGWGMTALSTKAVLFNKPSRIYNHLRNSSKWSILAVVVLIAEVSSGFSNSFVIWEPRVLYFILAALYVVMLLACLKTRSSLVSGISIHHFLSLMFVLRLSTSWILCREETSCYCKSTFYTFGSSSVPLWTLFAIGVLTLAFAPFFKSFWAVSDNFNGISVTIIEMTALALILGTVYWGLDTAESKGLLEGTLFGMEWIKVGIARASLSLGFTFGLYRWWKSNLPIQIVLNKEGQPKKLVGITNIYGSCLVLTCICLYWSLLPVNKPPAILALTGLLYCSISTLDLIDLAGATGTFLTPLLFDLLGNAFFYATGHQATIPSIQWDIAFVATQKLANPWSPLTVVLNTVGAFVIAAMFSVYAPLWRRSPFKDPKAAVVLLKEGLTGTVIVVGTRTLGSMIAAALHRRHLMAWKIFVPRYMLGGVVLIAVDVACVLSVVFGGHVIKKITSIFG